MELKFFSIFNEFSLKKFFLEKLSDTRHCSDNESRHYSDRLSTNFISIHINFCEVVNKALLFFGIELLFLVFSITPTIQVSMFRNVVSPSNITRRCFVGSISTFENQAPRSEKSNF